MAEYIYFNQILEKIVEGKPTVKVRDFITEKEVNVIVNDHVREFYTAFELKRNMVTPTRDMVDKYLKEIKKKPSMHEDKHYEVDGTFQITNEQIHNPSVNMSMQTTPRPSSSSSSSSSQQIPLTGSMFMSEQAVRMVVPPSSPSSTTEKRTSINSSPRTRAVTNAEKYYLRSGTGAPTPKDGRNKRDHVLHPQNNTDGRKEIRADEKSQQLRDARAADIEKARRKQEPEEAGKSQPLVPPEQ